MNTVYQSESCVPKRAAKITGSEHGASLVVVIMLMAVILAITGGGLLFSSMDLKVSGNHRAGTQAFYAADAGTSAAMAQLVADPTASVVAIAKTSMGNGMYYCTGTIIQTQPTCTNPQPIVTTSQPEPGYQVPGGGGYGAATTGSSFVSYQYDINVTGLGPLGATRQVEALGKYGPISNATK
jgi:Tfp pilus assembly protein PilX